MDIDRTTCAATLWMGLLGAADLGLRWPHPLGMTAALAAAAPFAVRLAVLAARPADPRRVRARDAEALVLALSPGDARDDRGGPRGGGTTRNRIDWRTAAL